MLVGVDESLCSVQSLLIVHIVGMVSKDAILALGTSELGEWELYQNSKSALVAVGIQGTVFAETTLLWWQINQPWMLLKPGYLETYLQFFQAFVTSWYTSGILLSPSGAETSVCQISLTFHLQAYKEVSQHRWHLHPWQILLVAAATVV